MAGRNKPVDVYLDLTHLGRHVTGIERVSIEQFEKVDFAQSRVIPIRSSGGTPGMIFKQQVVLPLLALFRPRAQFVFPGFPPSPLFALLRNRVTMYVHDTFLLTRRADLSAKARLYMAPQFSFAVRRLKTFLVNSEKTRADLSVFASADAAIALYRPAVANPFALTAQGRAERSAAPRPLRLVSLGTIEPRKNYGAAVDILDALRATVAPDAELHIVGRNGWGAAGREIAEHPGVTLHGYLPAAEVKQIIEAADLYLCTSHDEGLGLPLLEAQFAGLAVAAPDQPVFREVLGDSAIFLDPADSAAAARSIANLISSPNWRPRTVKAALANVAQWNDGAERDLATARQMFAAPAARPVPSHGALAR